MGMTQEEINTRQREYRRGTNNASTNKYEKTKKGFLVRLYRNMKSRIVGIHRDKHHLYKGKEILDKDLFYEWALSKKEYHTLFKIWENSGYDKRLAPSVDRVDSSLGYCPSNMEWVTHSENSRRGANSRWSRESTKT